MTRNDLEPQQLFDLSGKVAVVTGGSRGLGRTLVDGLAAAGADVVVTSRKLDSCQRAAEEVESSTGRRALALACHVGKWVRRCLRARQRPLKYSALVGVTMPSRRIAATTKM